MTDSPPARPSPFRWRHVLTGAVVLVPIVVCTVAMWVRSDGDLRAIEAEAAALGVPTRWEQTGRALAAPERLAAWGRIVALLADLKAYEPGASVPVGPQLPKPGEPIPDAMRDHHAALDPAKLTRLDAELAILGHDVLVRHATVTYSTRMPEINDCRKLANLMRDRVMLADDEDVAPLARRALDAVSTMEGAPLIAMLARSATQSLIASAIAFRLDDIRRHDDGDVHDALLRIAVATRGEVRASSEVEWLGCLEWMRNRGARDATGSMSGIQGTLLIRSGRGSALRYHLRWLAALKASDDPVTLIAEGRRLTVELAATPRWQLWNVLAGMLVPAFDLMVSNQAKVDLRLRLLAAELRGEAWPDDVFAPAPLRRIERDGRVIAAYSVGSDGRDDGGDRKKDVIIELYGTVEPAKPAP